MNETRMQAPLPEDIAFREAQLAEIDARIARVSRECCVNNGNTLASLSLR